MRRRVIKAVVTPKFDPQKHSVSEEAEILQTARYEWFVKQSPELAVNIRRLVRLDGTLVINEFVATERDLDVHGVPKKLSELTL